jgi:hypothetical protein
LLSLKSLKAAREMACGGKVKLTLVLFILCISGAIPALQAQARRVISFHFIPTFHQRPIGFGDTWYRLPGGDSVVFETLKYYISNVAFYNNGTPVFAEKESYHLVDASEDGKPGFTVDLPATAAYNTLRFSLGIDSATSTSGAMGGDLDPVKGMFWTWQSGYINLKLEGRSNACPTRQNRFQFHLGGYDYRNNSQQQVFLAVKPFQDINIGLPLDSFLGDINLASQNAIMIPGPEAVALSKKLAALFTVIRE